MRTISSLPVVFTLNNRRERIWENMRKKERIFFQRISPTERNISSSLLLFGVRFPRSCVVFTFNLSVRLIHWLFSTLDDFSIFRNFFIFKFAFFLTAWNLWEDLLNIFPSLCLPRGLYSLMEIEVYCSL